MSEPYTPTEIMTVAAARALKNDDVVFVGIGAVFIPDVRVGAGAIVGAGAVVIRDVAAGDVVAGVPAHSIKKGNCSPCRPIWTG